MRESWVDPPSYAGGSGEAAQVRRGPVVRAQEQAQAFDAAVEFDSAAAHRNIQAVRPGIGVFEVSAKTGEGMDRWLEFLESQRVASRRD